MSVDRDAIRELGAEREELWAIMGEVIGTLHEMIALLERSRPRLIPEAVKSIEDALRANPPQAESDSAEQFAERMRQRIQEAREIGIQEGRVQERDRVSKYVKRHIDTWSTWPVGATAEKQYRAGRLAAYKEILQLLCARVS